MSLLLIIPLTLSLHPVHYGAAIVHYIIIQLQFIHVVSSYSFSHVDKKKSSLYAFQCASMNIYFGFFFLND